MRIIINETYDLVLDNLRNHIPVRKRLIENGKDAGNYYDVVLGYHTNFESAFKAILNDMQVQEAENVKGTLSDFLDLFNKTNAKLLADLQKVAVDFKKHVKKEKSK